MKMNSIILFLLIILPYVQSCNRTPDNVVADKSPSEGWRIFVKGNPQYYQPYEKYNISLMGIQSATPQTFIEFSLVAEHEDNENGEEIHFPGNFDLGDNREYKFSDKCKNLIINTNTLPKSKVEVTWTAPPPGSGCVSFRGVVVQHRDVWFMDDGFLTKQFCEEEQDDIDHQSAVLEECCACDEAGYELTLESKWSRNTHPKDFPVDAWTTKFSDIMGASHANGWSFWKLGELATEGLRHVAEYGFTNILENELLEKIDSIRTVIKAKGLTYPNLNGSTFAMFRVDPVNHLVSLISKIQPSPDWIVGVSNLELCLSNCSWLENKVLNLYPLDAGTDSGASYLSPRQTQHPPDVIRRIKPDSPNDPRSPFYDPIGSPMKPIARLHISRKRLYEKTCGPDDENNNDPIECSTHPWTNWSDCDSKCGRGKRTRERGYKNKEISEIFGCNKNLVEEESCIGNNCGNFDQVSFNYNPLSTKRPVDRGGVRNRNNYHDELPDCALSEWEEYGECSVICGKGIMTRRREYLNPSFRRKCEKAKKETLEESKTCVGRNCAGNTDDNSNEDIPLRRNEVFHNNQDYDGRQTTNRGRDSYDATDIKYSGRTPSNNVEYGRGPYNKTKVGFQDSKDIQRQDRKFGNRFEDQQNPIVGSYEPTDTDNEIEESEKNEDKEFSECALSEWSDWSECTEKCGKGVKTASRYYINETAADRCLRIQNLRMYIEENCYGNTCAHRSYPRFHDREIPLPPHCKFNKWSYWGPCNATCDEGIKLRQREVWSDYNDESCGNKTQFQELDCSVECDIRNKFCYETPGQGYCVNITNYWYYDSYSHACGIFFTGDCQSTNYLNKFNSRQDCERVCAREPLVSQTFTQSGMLIEDLRLEKIDCIISKWFADNCNTTCGAGYRILHRKILQWPNRLGKQCPNNLIRLDKCYVPCNSSNKNTKHYIHNNYNKIDILNVSSNMCRYGLWSEWSICKPNCGSSSSRRKTRALLVNNEKCKDLVRIEKCSYKPC